MSDRHSPQEGDVAIEPGDEPRFRKAFALLGKKSKKSSRKITAINI